MLKVGITGGIGSGKTTACKIFEFLGIPVYYADDRAKYIMNHDPEVRTKIIEGFGQEAYKDGFLDRGYIAGIVFQDAEKLALINSIVHPAVALDSQLWFELQSAPYALKEAALLVENGSYTSLDLLISVSAPEDIRADRVMKRDGTSREQVLERMKNQLPQSEKDAVADYIIYNTGERSIIEQILKIHKELILL